MNVTIAENKLKSRANDNDDWSGGVRYLFGQHAP